MPHCGRKRNIMETKHLICIRCPLGCSLTASLENGQVTSVSGNTCPRGEAYARMELTAPMRTVTSTVRVTGARMPVISVKTASDIPKEKIEAVMNDIRTICVPAPIHIGDVLLENAAGTSVAVIATKAADAL